MSWRGQPCQALPGRMPHWKAQAWERESNLAAGQREDVNHCSLSFHPPLKSFS